MSTSLASRRQRLHDLIDRLPDDDLVWLTVELRRHATDPAVDPLFAPFTEDEQRLIAEGLADVEAGDLIPDDRLDI